jgi:protoporphyrinogen/coproporphyrinogen III oxidase
MRVAIIGGGVTGLAAAYALERQPVETVLFESSSRLGGKLQTEYAGDLILERGPDALFLRNSSTPDLLAELGLGDEVVRADLRHRKVTILRGGDFYPLPEGMESGIPRSIWPMATTRLLSPLGKARAAAEVLLPRANMRNEDESVDGFVRRRFGAEVAERIAAPLLGAIYSNDTRQLSLMATVAHLRAYEQEHGSLLLASLRGRLPGTRPSWNRGEPPRSPFIALRGGLGRIVERLRDSLARTQVRLITSVRKVSQTADGYDLELGDGQHHPVDRVILATPAFVTADLVESLSPQAAACLRTIRYASATVVALVFPPNTNLDVAPGSSGFLVAPGEPSMLAAVSWTSRKWPHCAPGGELLVRCHLHPDDKPELAELSDVALIEAVRGELRDLVGLDGEPWVRRVYRWPRSVPSYDVGHRERVRAIESRLAEFPGLVLAGAGYHGVGLPDCLRQGMQAADECCSASVPTAAATTT